MLISRAVLAFAVAATAWAGKISGPSSPFQSQAATGTQNQSSTSLNSKIAYDHNEANATGALNAPFRWVCVSKLNDRPTVTVETKGAMNGTCDAATKKTLKDLAVAKAGNSSINADAIAPVQADQATVYCRKEEFQISCQ